MADNYCYILPLELNQEKMNGGAHVYIIGYMSSQWQLIIAIFYQGIESGENECWCGGIYYWLRRIIDEAPPEFHCSNTEWSLRIFLILNYHISSFSTIIFPHSQLSSSSSFSMKAPFKALQICRSEQWSLQHFSDNCYHVWGVLCLCHSQRKIEVLNLSLKIICPVSIDGEKGEG